MKAPRQQSRRLHFALQKKQRQRDCPRLGEYPVMATIFVTESFNFKIKCHDSGIDRNPLMDITDGIFASENISVCNFNDRRSGRWPSGRCLERGISSPVATPNARDFRPLRSRPASLLPLYR